MNLIQTTLIHKIILPRKKDSKNPTLILLHGRGANEDDLLGLSDYLDERLFFISVRAPFNFSYGSGFTWFDIRDDGKPEPKMFSESYQKVVRFYVDISEGYPIDKSNVFLLGFSMGTMMSYVFSLANPGLVTGVVANSGYIPEVTDIKFQLEKLDGLLFFVAHGLYDPIIPIQLGRHSKEILEKAKAKVTYKEYPMAHQISEESLSDFSNWLTVQINKMKDI